MTFELITHSYKQHSEDIHGSTQNSFWVIDGALPLNTVNNTGHYSDVVWMVSWWQQYLSAHMEYMDKSIVTILEEGVVAMNKAFEEYADINEVSKLDRASASIGVVRINGDRMECYVLGDTEVSIKTLDGNFETLIDDKIEAFDSQVMSMIYNNKQRASEIAFNGYTKEELDVLRNNRLKMNSEDGYYILEHDEGAIKHGIYKEYALTDVYSTLIMSDGYSAIYNKYKKYDLGQLFDACEGEGLDSILYDIRKIEKEDSELKIYKRLRLHDDATAVYMNMQA